MLLNLAWTVYFEGKFALRGGLDPTRALAEAEELCGRSLEIRRRPRSLLCLGSVRRMQADYRLTFEDFEATAALTATSEALFEEILRLDENHAEAHRSLGRLMTLKARQLRKQNLNPEPALARAREFLDQASKLKGKWTDFHLADARWHLERALWLQTVNKDASKAIEAGRSSLNQISSPQEALVEILRLRAKLDTIG